ncbi:translin-associated protein X isoform X1 [Capsicum galapagoense]
MLFYASKSSFLLMAPKPQRIRHMVGTTWQRAMKKARTMSTDDTETDSSMKDAFSKYADYLNNINDKRERVVKASRDITMNSKKVIFQVHRISKQNKEEVLDKAVNDLTAVTDQYLSRLVKELQGTDFWKLRRAYSPGVQEYVEAATLCNFCKTGTLLTLDEINATLLPLSDPSVEPLQINILDYMLGLADLTGELMRLAIGRISEGELDFAEKICSFVREIYRNLTLIAPEMDDSSDMKQKMETMLQSVMKIENGSRVFRFHLDPEKACFSVHVRGSEYIPLLGSADTSYPLLGMPDIE